MTTKLKMPMKRFGNNVFLMVTKNYGVIDFDFKNMDGVHIEGGYILRIVKRTDDWVLERYTSVNFRSIISDLDVDNSLGMLEIIGTDLVG